MGVSSKALAGVAIGYERGQPLRGHDFTGGEATAARVLRRLGFSVLDIRSDPTEARPHPLLQRNRPYSWQELGDAFGFRPGYFAVAGGMLPVRDLRLVVLVSHPRGGRTFDYGDEWDGPELIFTRRSLDGPQRLEGANRDVADNRRPLYVFEHAGTERLRFVGYGRCVDVRPDFAPDRSGEMRRVYRFRLAFDDLRETRALTTRSKRRSSFKATTEPPAAALRRPRPFNPTKSPRSYTRETAEHERPEETAARREKAVRAHHNLVASLLEALQSAGWTDTWEIPLAIDLYATAPSGQRVLFEAKTLTASNEGTQVRGGLAQLLEYRFLYCEPSDELCLVTDTTVRPARVGFLHALGIDVISKGDSGFFSAGHGGSAASVELAIRQRA